MSREPLLKKSPQRIGEILVQKGWITNEALGRALDAQARSAVKRVGEILRAAGQVSEEQLAQALAEQYHLEYIDLERLAAGWRIDRQVYTFKWKYLRVLPMRDPENRAWILITDTTVDEKLPLDATADKSDIRFGVATSTVLEQVMWENPAPNELESPPVVQRLELPSKPDPDSMGDARETVSGLAMMDVPRALRIVGALWGQCAAEVQRNAVVSFTTGPRFRIEVRQIVPEITGELPPGYVAQVTSRLGRMFEVDVALPRYTVSGSRPELPWPPVWPPPDLVDSVKPLLAGMCKVPAGLRAGGDSLRWMGTRSPSRDALNAHLVGAMGVTLGHSRIDDLDELWAAVRARVRTLDANQAVRTVWDRWKSVSAPGLEIPPGHVLALTSLATGLLPGKLAPALGVTVEPGPLFFVELWRSAAATGAEPAGLSLRVGCPSA